jgi:predicted XRE-type DNA-binding protein
MKKSKFPSENELKKIRGKLSRAPAARPIPLSDSPVDKAKFDICQKLLKFMHDHDLSQRQLAGNLGISEALVSKIVRGRVEQFTIDRLLGYLAQLYDKLNVKIVVA